MITYELKELTKYVAGNATEKLKLWISKKGQGLFYDAANATDKLLDTVEDVKWSELFQSGGPPLGSNKVTGSFTFKVPTGQCNNVTDVKFLNMLAKQVKKTTKLTISDDQVKCKATCSRRLAQDRRLSKDVKVNYEITGLSSKQARAASDELKTITADKIKTMVSNAATEASLTVSASNVGKIETPKLVSGSSFAAIIGLSMGSFLAVVGNVI